MKSEIQKFIKGEVEDGDDILSLYSHDASLLEVRPRVVVFPKDSEDVQKLVKWVGEKHLDPENPESGPSITPRCAGTDMSGGAIGESIILDFSRHMNGLVGGPLPIDAPPPGGKKKDGVPQREAYPKVPSYITVQPGMFYRDFEKITLAKGLILPCYTASKSLNAMGGMYGNNSAGERTLKYGKTEDYILEAKVIFADGNEYTVKPLTKSELDQKIAQGGTEGEIYKNIYGLIQDNESEIKQAKPRVHKNSAGYFIWNIMQNSKDSPNHPNPQNLQTKNFGAIALGDNRAGDPRRSKSLSGDFGGDRVFDLNKLLVGSQGTLGIATEITFKVIPNTRNSKLVVVFMNDLAPLGSLVDEILTLNPETLETYDDKTMKLAVRFFPDFLKNKGFLGMLRFMWSFLPEAGLVLTGGVPKLILLIEFAGESEEEVNRKCAELGEKIKHFKLKVHITENQIEANKYWDIRRESFALLRKHVRGMRTAPFIDDIIVRPEFLPKFLPELNAILDKYKRDLTFTLAGHAGDGNFHIIPLMDFSRPGTAKIILELGEKVYDLVVKYHGSITAEHNDGIIRTPYLAKMYEPHIIDIFAKIKKIFDPKNIFNPGKKVPVQNGPGTKAYIRDHIAQEHKAKHGS